MSTLELVLNMLAEATTTELSKAQQPEGFKQNKDVARQGGTIAGDTRKSIEQASGRPVITVQNAADFVDLLQDVSDKVDDSGKTGDSN